MNKQIQEIAAMIDHTCLKANASDEDMKKLCAQAAELGVAMVAVNSCQTALCAKLLEGTGVHVGAAISFPLGQTSLPVKLFETQQAIADGADEIDYVVNLTNVKNGQWDLVRDEMEQMVELCSDAGVICKVVFETCCLTDDEIRRLAEIAKDVRPDYIKTSTGFGTAGASVENVRLMKEVVGDDVSVKAAGGIRDYETFKAMVEAGARRIGTSSTLKILEEAQHALDS